MFDIANIQLFSLLASILAKIYCFFSNHLFYVAFCDTHGTPQ